MPTIMWLYAQQSDNTNVKFYKWVNVSFHVPRCLPVPTGTYQLK